MLMFLFPVSRFVRAIVLDKEKRVKETMKIMGLKPSVIDMAWFLSMSVQMLVTAVCVTIILISGVYTFSSGILVFVFVLAWGMSVVTLCFLLSVFFSKSKAAATVGPMLFFALYFPYYAVEDPSTPALPKTLSCIFAPTCMAVTSSVFTSFESGQIGVQPGNVFTTAGNISYATCIAMLCFDCVLYAALSVYLDKVLPSEYGLRRHWAYPLAALRDCVCRRSASQPGRLQELSTSLLRASDSAEHSGAEEAARVEAVGGDLQAQVGEGRCVATQGLRKEFGPKVAVHRLDLQAFEGQCTVLLGHNGAGKTTTISMITGLIPPTAGDAFVRGKSIRSDMNSIRTSLGVCPQHDVLFPELNVRQHLEIFAAFKNVPHAHIPAAAEDMIRRVGLKEKAGVKAGMLSGGQKRKLSVGIALIGDSKTVVLDEPSSGMDPYSRRSMWDLLQEAKAGRVLMLTTHFMDEADILGDRIAIMGDGRLRCCGSSLFLKREYGVGYTLTVLLVSANQDPRHVSKLVESHVPAAEPLSSVGAEVTYRLPFEASPVFRELFTALEQGESELGVAEYGLSVTTLEEVFLLVASNEREAGKSTDAAASMARQRRLSGSDVGDEAGQSLKLNESIEERQIALAEADDGTATALFCGQFSALFAKRFHYARRDLKNLICQVVVPAFLVLQGLILLTVVQFASIEGGPELVMDPTAQFNTDVSEPALRNFVPIRVPQPAGSNPDAEALAAQFDMGVVRGQAVQIADPLADEFDGCAQGTAAPNDLTNTSNFLLSAANYDLQPTSSRYGAVTFSDTTSLADSIFAYNLLVNATALHAAPTFVNLVNTAILRELDTASPTASITVSNKPLPLTRLQNDISQSGDAFSAATYIVIAFAFLPASYAIFVVRERETGSKHQQLISGVSLPAYWLATFSWDVVSYLIPSGLSIVMFVAFGVDAYTTGQGLTATALLFLLYGPAVAGQTYCFSFVFKSHSTAQNVVLLLNFVFGLGLMVTSFVLDALENTREINQTLKHFFRLLPGFCLGNGLTQLSFCQDSGDDGDVLCPVSFFAIELKRPLDLDVAGMNLLYLGVECVVYFAICLHIEVALTFPAVAAIFQRVRDPGHVEQELDEDVAAEAQRVLTERASEECVRLQGLRKVYSSPIGPKVAVQNLSFGIATGECFGFLGINGAGKTTTLSILSGDIAPTSGRAYIDGLDIETEQLAVRRLIGYCPQHDALLDLLTVREHLELYARIKGVRATAVGEVAYTKMEQLDLLDFADKQSRMLSGGNKRKLSVAIAMIGSPKVVFLDEPSTGMDPVARRYMWDVISALSTRDAQCSVILTTHSMEEAEALCTRIGIMVNGQLRCLGTPQHLKNRFGSGVELDVKTELPSSGSVRSLLAKLRGQAPHLLSRDDDDACHLTVGLSDSSLCAALGRPDRADVLLNSAAGASLRQANASGSVGGLLFCEWWLAEDVAEQLHSGLSKSFPSGLELLERSASNAFRYRLQRGEGGPLSLADVFGEVEDAKDALSVATYAVSETTLEQIFNQFAAQQENPENS